MNNPVPFNAIDIVFLGYCGWLLFTSKGRRTTQELTALCIRLVWIFATFHFYTGIASHAGRWFSFLTPSAVESSAFFLLMSAGGFLSSVLINMTGVFIKPTDTEQPHDVLAKVVRLFRGCVIASFFMYFLMLTGSHAAVRAVEGSFIYSTPLKRLSADIYEKICWIGSKVSPLMNAEQEVVSYATERDLPADSGNGDGKRPPAERNP